MAESVTIDPSVRFLVDADRPVHLGPGVKLYRGTEILGPVSIGAKSFINTGGYVRAQVTIGKNVAIGPFCRLVSDSHEMGPSRRRAGRNTFLPIVIGDGCWLGAGVTVLGGVTIGAGSVVAAGSVVVHDVPTDTLVGGVPARIIRPLD